MRFNYFLIGVDDIYKVWFKYMHTLITKDVKLLVVHCSDTKDNQNLSAVDLHKMHLTFGWELMLKVRIILA